jgi:DNA-binding PadR family transcriptional regulator
MIATHDTPRAFVLQGPAPTPATRRDLLTLLVLRELEGGGPRAGAAIFDGIAALACSFDLDAPGYALLHDMCDAGLLVAVGARPPRYAITPSGRSKAEKLAVRCWPGIRDALVDLNVCVGCLAPRS